MLDLREENLLEKHKVAHRHRGLTIEETMVNEGIMMLLQIKNTNQRHYLKANKIMGLGNK